MDKNRIYRLVFASVYPLYIKKAERKGRTKEEVDTVIFWLTGYNKQTLQKQIDMKNDFEAFFVQARNGASLAGRVLCVVHLSGASMQGCNEHGVLVSL